MLVYLFKTTFYLLLFLLVFSTLSKHVCANGNLLKQPQSPPKKKVEIFKNEDIVTALKEQCKEEPDKITIDEYYNPFFISISDVIVALVGVTSTCKNDKKIYISVLTKQINTKENNVDWKEKIFADSPNTNWKVQLGPQKSIGNQNDKSVLKGTLAVASKNNNEPYLLLVNCNNKEDTSDDSDKTSCDFEIVVGKIDDGKKDKISWEYPKPPSSPNNYKFTSQFEKQLELKDPIFGTAFIANNEKMIFVLKAKATTDNKHITVIVSSKEKKEDGFEILINNGISEHCHPYIFLLSNKIIMLTPDCNQNSETTLKESIDINSGWKNVEGPLSRLIEFLKDKNDFTTATINNVELILFTQEVKDKEKPSGAKSELYLWISDGTRAAKVGEITTESKCTTLNNIFHVKDELFLLKQKCKDNNKVDSIELTLLEDQKTNITTVLNAWGNTKKTIEQLCKDSIHATNYCSTDGLVSFLFTKQENDNKWHDELLYADATITNNAQFENGLKCYGAGQGAIWPVGKSAEEQPYNFTAHGFTILATMTIDKNVEGKDNSLLGIVFEKPENNIGLWCTKNNKFGVSSDKDDVTKIKSVEMSCNAAMTYQVAIILDKSSKLSVYVNGNKLSNAELEKLNIDKLQNITHFYFGASFDENKQHDAESHITVQYVLLYNRPFNSDEELKKLINYGKTIEASNKAKENTATEGAEGSNGDSSSEERLDLSIITNEKENVPSTLVLRESAVCAGNSVIVVYVLLLLSVFICHFIYKLQ